MNLVCNPGSSVFLVKPQVEKMLEKGFTSLTGFDAYQLDKVTHGHPLSTLAYFLMHKASMITTFSLDAQRLVKFLRAIESGCVCFCAGTVRGKELASSLSSTEAGVSVTSHLPL